MLKLNSEELKKKKNMNSFYKPIILLFSFISFCQLAHLLHYVACRKGLTDSSNGIK